MVAISSWGRLNREEHRIIRLNNAKEVIPHIHQQSDGIAFGKGRSYGDICLNPGGILWDTTGLNRYISFDVATGILRCEAGVLLKDIQNLMIPRGFMLPVTPGTQYVTLGGAIANDVHGKNHHARGSFGHHISWLKLARTDGQIIECSPTHNHEWFAATVGGLGLTGIITEVEIKLISIAGPWLSSETISYTHLTNFFALADESSQFEYTVSWIDCLQKKACRGLFMRANHTKNTIDKIQRSRRKLSIPFTPPFSLVNNLTLPSFNMFYFYRNKCRPNQTMIDYESFLYPLDNIIDWNRMYGRKGFFQYQCVVPFACRYEAIQAILKAIARAGMGSFLSVLKTFGDQPSLGMMSFPLAKGATLALDFPNQGKKTLTLFNRLDAIVHEAGGRVYLAKDARLSRSNFKAAYINLEKFLLYRDPGMSSAMSKRLIDRKV